MKENFYIFLDIDGVMFDWDFIQSCGENFKVIETLSPESCEALNYLIQKLSYSYQPKLVISSSWRRNMEHTVNILRKHNIKIDINNIYKTDFSYETMHQRGKEILSFLQKENCKTNNYVIIDDDMFDFEKYFSSDRIIKTDVHKESLRKHMIDNFLKINNISTEEEFCIN